MGLDAREPGEPTMTKPATKRLSAVFVIAWACAAALRAQPPQCDAYLKEIGATAGAGDDAYRFRGAGSEDFRCEGTFKIETSGGPTELTVVSFTRGPIAYALDPQLVLEVTASPETRKGAGSIAVRALPQEEGKNYQMDAVLPASGRLVWPAGEILEPHGIRAEQIGLYGAIRKGDQTTFVPLSVGVRGKNGPESSQILLAVRYPYTLSKLEWRAGQIDDVGECVSPDGYTRQLHRTGRKPIAIDLSGVKGDCLELRLQRGTQTTSERAVLRVALPQIP
jgi:hypothetical protein